MRIGFTGHRDCVTTDAELDRIAAMYPGAVWVHGGAIGFDTQVDKYAKAHGLPEPEVIRPEYKKYDPMVAPIMRNYVIVDTCDALIVCYDGWRLSGGTYRTKKYAQAKGKIIHDVICLPLPKPIGKMIRV